MHLLDIKSNATYAEPRQNNPCVLCFCEFVYLCICVLCICVFCVFCGYEALTAKSLLLK